MSGRFRSSLIVGGQGIRARKLRTLLSMLSLFLGVLAVVVVQAGAEIMKDTVTQDIELNQGKDGTVRMYLPSDQKTAATVLEILRGRTDAVASLTTNAIIGEPGVRPINPGGGPIDEGGPMFGDSGWACDSRGMCFEVGRGGNGEEAQPPGQAVELRLTGLTADILPFRPFRHKAGQWLDFSGEPSLAPRIVINTAAAKAFTRHAVPGEMRIDGATANPTPRIVGVVDDGGYSPTAYVRTDELLNWIPQATFGAEDRGFPLDVMLAPGALDVEQRLRARLIAAGVPGDQLHTERINAKKDIEQELALMRWIFLGMAGLVLLIGVAGILNVGLATVGERIEEFALRRAVGTPRMLLAGIVLAETLLTGLFTATAAIGIGMLGVRVGSMLFASQHPSIEGLSFPWQAGVAGVTAGLIAGLLGGLIPAIRAARIPIANVMRA